MVVAGLREAAAAAAAHLMGLAELIHYVRVKRGWVE